MKGASDEEALKRKRQQTDMTSIWKWENGNLQIKKSLLDGLQITETAKEVISVVGAGGKTTTIRRLTDEMEKDRKMWQ